MKNNIDSLKDVDNKTLLNIVKKSHGHPLILECMLHQIYLGKPVEQALSEMENTELDKVFEFCFGTTYSMLGTDSQKILTSIVLFDKNVGIREISFVCNLHEQSVSNSLEELKRFSLVKEKVENSVSLFFLLPVIKKYVQIQMASRRVLISDVIKRFELYQKEISNIQTKNIDDYGAFKNFNFSNDIDKLAANLANTALNEYNHTGDYAEAVTTLNSALTLSPTSSYVCQIRALIEKSEEFFGEAAKWYDRATSNDPNNSYIWRLWGDLEKGFSNYHKAKEKYEEATKWDIEDKRAWYGLGYCQSQIAKEFYEKQNFSRHETFRDQADFSFKKAAYTDPISRVEKIHNSKVYHQMGFNLFHLQKYQEVSYCCKEGLKCDPQNKYLTQLKERAERKL